MKWRRRKKAHSTGWREQTGLPVFTFVIQVLYFYNKTRKYDNIRVARRTLVKALKAELNVSSTGCDNELQLFAKLSYSAIDNVLTNLLPADLQDFVRAQRLETDYDGKQAVGVLSRSNSPLSLSLGYLLPILFTARSSYASAVSGNVLMSVRLSILPSHACFVTKRKNIRPMFWYCMKR